ncbi:hypothetical protein J2I47_15560 [Fibrella sp. HMF5335]|uniref:Uncharacterized protein n=1 Tax=Fibrella rubiginis TaxID=2817060 RepID=A0A939K5P0_9BACT|nr:hypothetical protein [Fibrella rubiginis]MBO0937973.1 hypothetical protein [Fibrella rubiginis]
MEAQKVNIEQPLTAEQIISAHKALSVKKRKKVRQVFRIIHAFKVVQYRKRESSTVKKEKRLFVSAKAGLELKGDVQIGDPFREHSTYKYLSPPNQLWHLNALLGDDLVNQALEDNNGRLSDSTIIDLLAKHSLPFYTDTNERILFLGENKLAERELGPLKPISAVEAVQRYGLAKLEEASEKSYTQI